jgi:hypothetical protein
VLQRTKMLIKFKQEKEKLENEMYQIRQNKNEGICTAGLKPTDSCRESFISIKYSYFNHIFIVHQ